MRVLGWLRRAPFSTALIVAAVVVHVFSGAFLGRLPRTVAGTWGYQSTDLLSGNWWNMFTTLFLSSTTGSMLLGVGVVGAAVGIAEFTLGSLRTAAIFCATQGAAVVLYAVVLGLGNLGDIDWPTGLD